MASPTSFTDYVRACGTLPQSFYKMLAQCITLENGHYKLNIIEGLAACADLHSFWTCDNSHLDPDNALVDNIFAYDPCGNLAVKVMLPVSGFNDLPT